VHGSSLSWAIEPTLPGYQGLRLGVATPQPGGFAGLGSVLEPLHAKHPSLPERNHVPEVHLDRGPAPRSAHFISLVDQDLVAPGIHDLGFLRRYALEGLEGLDVEVPRSLGTAHAWFGPVTDVYDFEVVIVEREVSGPVAPLNGVHRLAHDLHVLL